jgi:chromosome segregation ATPase
MEDYEYYYRYYRGKYTDACSEYNSCDRQIYRLQQQRNTASRSVNSLNSKIRNLERTLEKLEDILNKESTINSKLTAVNTKTQQAAVNYSGMVSSSDVSNKDLSSVYSGETRATQTSITSVFDTVRTKKNTLTTQLNEAKEEQKRQKQAIEDIDRQLRSLRSDLNYWSRQKKNYHYNMDYYRRKMNAAG